MVEGDRIALYHLGDDPGESSPLPLEEHPELVAKLRPMANHHKQMPVGSITESGEMSAEMLEELQALGYVDAPTGEGK